MGIDAHDACRLTETCSEAAVPLLVKQKVACGMARVQLHAVIVRPPHSSNDADSSNAKSQTSLTLVVLEQHAMARDEAQLPRIVSRNPLRLWLPGPSKHTPEGDVPQPRSRRLPRLHIGNGGVCVVSSLG
jgi:hypothetical protein